MALTTDAKTSPLKTKVVAADGGDTSWQVTYFGETIVLKIEGDTEGMRKSPSAQKIISFIDKACQKGVGASL